MKTLAAAIVCLAMTMPAIAAEQWYMADRRYQSCPAVADNWEGAKTPEQVRDRLQAIGSFYVIERVEPGVVLLNKIGEDNTLIFFTDRHRCILAIAAAGRSHL